MASVMAPLALARFFLLLLLLLLLRLARKPEGQIEPAKGNGPDRSIFLARSLAIACCFRSLELAARLAIMAIIIMVVMAAEPTAVAATLAIATLAPAEPAG